MCTFNQFSKASHFTGFYSLLWLLGTLLLSPSAAIGQEAVSQAEPEKKKSSSVAKRVEGEWIIVRGINRGREVPKKELEGSLVVVRDQTIVVLDPKQETLYKATYTIDPTAKPFQIDMRAQKPGAAVSLGLGIFEFTAKGWKLAYALPGKMRPTDFKIKAGSAVMYFEFERAPEPEEKPLRTVEDPLAE